MSLSELFKIFKMKHKGSLLKRETLINARGDLDKEVIYIDSHSDELNNRDYRIMLNKLGYRNFVK